MVYVFDVDGTLLDNSARIHWIKDPLAENESIGKSEARAKNFAKHHKNWDKYYSREETLKDTPIPGVKESLAAILENLKVQEDLGEENSVIVMTGRMKKSLALTREQLDTFYPGFSAHVDSWIFRSDDDFRPAPKYKGQELEKISNEFEYHDKIAFDDDVRIYPEYRKNGFLIMVPPLCWQVIR